MQMSNPIDVELRFNLHVNNRAFRFTGVSHGVPGSGMPTADLSSSDQPPPGFHVGLLSYVALTGHPFMSRSLPGAENPFLKTGGVYSAIRRLNLGDSGSLVTDYRVERGVHGLVETFDVTGHVNVPKLISVAPTVETWVPRGPGKIFGHFVMVWAGEDGTLIYGKAETEYRLALERTISGTQFRDIRIQLSCSDTHLHQAEQITIFTPIHLADFLGIDKAISGTDAEHPRITAAA